MSSMIRINSSAYVKVSCIEAVETEQDGVYVYTSTSKFKTDIPIWQIINIIDLQEIQNNIQNNQSDDVNNSQVDMTKQFVSL